MIPIPKRRLAAIRAPGTQYVLRSRATASGPKGLFGSIIGKQGIFSVSSEYKNGLGKPSLAYQTIIR